MAETWIALMTRCRQVGWTSKLQGGPFAAWVKFLMTVKDLGQPGGFITVGYLDNDWLEKHNVTFADWSIMLAAAIKDGAIVQENGVFAVANWGKYQRDPTAVKRQRDWRDRQKDQTENGVTLRNGSNGDSTVQDSTGQDSTKNSVTKLPTILNTPEFKKVWADWERHRRDIHHALKTMTRQRQLKKLAKVAEVNGIAEAIGMIEQSIEQGWQGLFAVKSEGAGDGRSRKGGIGAKEMPYAGAGDSIAIKG